MKNVKAIVEILKQLYIATTTYAHYIIKIFRMPLQFAHN